jgi:hypothetical protein
LGNTLATTDERFREPIFISLNSRTIVSAAARDATECSLEKKRYIHTYTYTYTYTDTDTDTNTYTYAFTYTYAYVYIYMCVCTHVETHIYNHI